MKPEHIEIALNEISDKNLLEALSPKVTKKKRLFWKGLISIAACVAVLVGILNLPQPVAAKAISLAEYPEYEWVYRDEMRGTVVTLSDFFEDGISLALANSKGENQLFSPINLYMAVSMVAELTEDQSRAQILSALGAEDIEALRLQANSIWDACYRDDKDKTLLANSVWLSDKYRYNQTVMDTLSSVYYASVYHADLADNRTARDIRAWLNNNTGGMLNDEVKNAAGTLNSDSVLALYSTIHYQAKWAHSMKFSAKLNSRGVFHTNNGDVICTYMNKKLVQTYYYWLEDCSAVSWSMKGGRMWFILPDEGKSVDDVLSSGSYMDLLLGGSSKTENVKYMKVNFSVPKFDVRSSVDMKAVLETMGITDVFHLETADFSSSVHGSSVVLTNVNQSTRVCIDEEGVTAASYVEIPGAGSAEPPEEIIDFVLDRPFLFVVENTYNIPLFAGVVNQP